MTIKKEGYGVKLRCDNCDKVRMYNIPLGMTVAKFSESEGCPHCRCKGGLRTTIMDVDEEDEDDN